jgi:hypothetical protein
MRRAALFLLLLIPGSCWAQEFALTRLDPSSTIASATDTTLNVYGQNFAFGATINWNGQAQSTTFISQGQLTAIINTPKFATPGAAQVTVTQSGITSAPLTFQILTPMAGVKSYQPTVFTPGSDTTITVYGQGFNPNATVFFDWFALVPPNGSTTFVSSGVLSAVVPGSLISSSGPHRIAVYNATPPAGLPSLAVPQVPFTFGSVTISSPSAMSFPITNISTINVTLGTPYYVISGLNAADFSNPGGSGSCTNGQVLIPGSNCTVYVTFTPSTAANETAILTINSNGIGAPQNVTLSGSGIAAAAPAESFSFTVLAFGNQQTGTASQPIVTSLTNAGNANLVISALSVTGANAADFALGGTCTGSTTLSAGSSCTMSVVFTPSTTSTESAQISITDNTVGSVRGVGLTGTGTATAAHFVSLAWTASTSGSLVGYNVYRGTTTGGPYSLLTPTPVGGTTYNDTAVTHGTQYFYVLTSVGTNPPYSPIESVNSTEVNATP